MKDMRLLRALMGYPWKRGSSLLIRSPDTSLDQFGFGGLGRLVVVIKHPVKGAIVVKTGVDIG
jgi:hypothetical protein